MHFLIAVMSTISYSSSLAYSWHNFPVICRFVSFQVGVYIVVPIQYTLAETVGWKLSPPTFPTKENSADYPICKPIISNKCQFDVTKDSLQRVTNEQSHLSQNSHYSRSITNSGGKRLKHYFSVKSICDGDFWLPNISSN